MPPFEGRDIFPGPFEDEPEQEPPANAEEAPGPVPAGFLMDEGEDVLDFEELVQFGLLTPPPSPVVAAPDDLEPPADEEPVFANAAEYHAAAEFAWQQLGEFLEFLQALDAADNGGPGEPQAPVASASGSLDGAAQDNEPDEV